jgi:hypothetical protein
VATPTDLTGSIAQQAVEPIASTADGQSNTGRTIAELIAANNYIAACVAAKSKRRGLLFTKLLAPAAAPGACPGGTAGCGGW